MFFVRTILFFSTFFVSIFVSGQKVAVISDIHGNYPASFDVAFLASVVNPDIIITCGDNHYGSLNSIDTQVGQYYQSFISPYIGAFGNGSFVNKFFPALGNHDEDGNDLQNYLSYFTLPGNERYYDFIVGDFHFFALDCLPNEPDGVSDTSVQAIWLKNNLMNSTQKFNIVYFHFPPFSSCNVHGSCTYMQWPFKQWGATAVFSGHNHVFEHLCIDNFNYFVCGCGGGNLYSFGNQLNGSIFRDSLDHGLMLLEPEGDSLVCQFINTNDSLVYKSVIYKSPDLSGTQAASKVEGKFIYYNAANKQIVISGKLENTIVYIFSMKGETMLENSFSGERSNLCINVSNFNPGEYIIKVVTLTQTISKKIIII